MSSVDRPAAAVAVTGSASGIGRAVADALRADGRRVIGVDLHDADVIADLSTADGRSTAARGVLELAGGTLGGAVLAAGLGPAAGRERATIEVNLLGVTALLEAWRPALAVTGDARVVVLGSNSTTTTPFVPRRAIRELLRGEVDAATRRIRRRRGLSAPVAYAASKIAVTRWVRRRAVRPEWAGAGIRLNVLAPGPVLTPLLRAQLDGPTGENVRSFPIPVRRFGTADVLASWALFMLSPAADVLVGSVIVVDGGTDALIRPSTSPAALPLRGVPRLLWRMYRAPRDGQVADYSGSD
ncbi:SDR family oxidoreductase [Gordonia soli]|uniref:Putative oxidoreductase n=1 Tax=Gordonia soli NBRC 108243 TaxID=1223545 RepID=M0QFU5_9ACTN|nr:SDR family oxidoreductase [Gordonia soli]GAC67324.1 putative oxidoreductase [Gordonia soli NBRC 108243]